MKTMKRGDEIIRVSESDVKSKLAQGFAYCQKSEWKQKVRDVNKGKTSTECEKSETTKSKGKQTPKGKAKKSKQ